MFNLTQVTSWLNRLTISGMESTLAEAEHIPLWTLGEILTQVWVAETVARVVFLNRALALVVEALDLAVVPLRLITEGSGVMVEEDSSESEGDFAKCRDDL